MKPLDPMKPMSPMKPLSGGEPWWPEDLGEPSSSGAQNDLHYAFFAARHRLLVKKDGVVTSYDSGEHEITGLSQQHGDGLSFTSQHGTVALADLQKA